MVIGHLGAGQSITQGLAQIFTQVVANAQRAPLAFFIIGTLLLLLDGLVEQIEAGGQVAVEELRLGEADVELAATRRRFGGGAEILAAAEEIPLAQGNLHQSVFDGRKPKTEI